MSWLTVHIGDCRDVLDTLSEASVHCVVTSPPYWGLRDYGVPSQIGLEPTPEMYVAGMVAVCRQLRRVLRDDGTVWLNLGDSYVANGGNTKGASSDGLVGRSWSGLNVKTGAGLKPKDLVGIPWRVAFALQADGWYLRSDIIWAKPNPMPESVTDRPTKAHEYLFLLSKRERYYFDQEAVREASTGQDSGNGFARPERVSGGLAGGNPERWVAPADARRNIRSVWTIATQPYPMQKVVRSEAVGADAVGGDIRRTRSRGCPLHGDRPAPAATAPDDGRASPSLDGSRSPDTSGHPDPARPPEPAPTGPLPGQGSAAGSSDWPPPTYEPAATPRSSGSHRTDPDAGTSPAYTPSGGSPARIADTSASPDGDEPPLHMPGSSTEPDETAAHSPDRSSPRTADTPSCTCSYRRVTTESVSHFAVFPEALVEPCIKAGTSERGVCGECGAPWERVVERARTRDGQPLDGSWARPDEPRRLGPTGVGHWRDETTVTTTGWRPTCAHDAEPVPATVLDCFGGSGTVARVANRLSRRAVLIELNPEYATQIEKRNLQAPLGLGA